MLVHTLCISIDAKEIGQPNKAVKNLEPAYKALPAHPHSMIRAAIATCKYKSTQSHCTQPHNNKAGICLPEKQGQLACLPKHPPPHLPPRFRH